MNVTVAGAFGPILDGLRAHVEQAVRFGKDCVLIARMNDELARETCSEPRPIPAFSDRTDSYRKQSPNSTGEPN